MGGIADMKCRRRWAPVVLGGYFEISLTAPLPAPPLSPRFGEELRGADTYYLVDKHAPHSPAQHASPLAESAKSPVCGAWNMFECKTVFRQTPFIVPVLAHSRPSGLASYCI